VIESASTTTACERAFNVASVDDAILITGSLYVVGEAAIHDRPADGLT